MFKQAFARIKALISPAIVRESAPVYVPVPSHPGKVTDGTITEPPFQVPARAMATYQYDRVRYAADREEKARKARNARRKDREKCRAFVRALNQARG